MRERTFGLVTVGLHTSVPDVQSRKKSSAGVPLVMVTAYDTPGALIVDKANVDIILVGDSLGMVVLGYDDTLSVTIEDMVHHTRAVARAKPRALLVADLPWMTYHLSKRDTLRNASQLIRAGAQAVKLEGGAKRRRMIEALVDAEIPVMGHLGLTPQSVNVMGGFKVQARDSDQAQTLIEEAELLAQIGCFSLVLEGIPSQVSEEVTNRIPIPTIGIGAGIHCDGQVLVFHDILGFQEKGDAKFVRRYADIGKIATKAIEDFARDVQSGRYPQEKESYGL